MDYDDYYDTMDQYGQEDVSEFDDEELSCYDDEFDEPHDMDDVQADADTLASSPGFTVQFRYQSHQQRQQIMAKIKTLDDIVNSIVQPSASINVAALQEAIATRAEARKKAVAETLVKVFEQGEKNLQAQVGYLRDLRKKEKMVKENVDKMAEAIKFLGETGNPFPILKLNGHIQTHEVCQALGMSVPDDKDPIWNIK
jgi:ribosomal protein S9